MSKRTNRKRALLLTSKTGGGHVSLAEAIHEQLESHFDCKITDPQPSIVHTHYRLVSRYALRLWQLEYRLADRPHRAQAAHRLFARLMGRAMRSLLAREQPDLIVSTYSFFTAAMRNAIHAIGRPVATVLLLSDPQNVHATWLAVKDVDCILAPTRETEAQALAAGFAPHQVHLSGWPVRRQFHNSRITTQERQAALQKLGLHPDRFTVFLQGGGEGTARFGRTVEAVLAAGEEGNGGGVQIILAVGTNETLRARYARTPNVYPLPFTKEIAHYMALADVIMGKAGPNMLFETVTLGKPFIATTYIPGQETPNLDFIRRYHLGWVALNAGDQAALIHKLAHEPAMLAAQTNSVDAYRRWNLERLETVLPQVQQLVETAQTPAVSRATL
jgi:UDP-N-acetylglucosamine:LPS N-acetylglucosamine transferase